MSPSTPRTVSSQRRTTVDSDVFLAMIITNDRSAVLRALTSEAVGHFGRGHLHIDNVIVSPSVDGLYLATAHFRATASPQELGRP